MSKADHQDKLRKPKQFLYRGESMRSTFSPGQLLYIHPEAKKPEPGDVVIYRKDESYVVHRVERIEGSVFVTRGDNNPHPDDLPVLPDQLIGVVSHVRQGAHIVPVSGGWRGLLSARFRWIWTGIINWLRPLIGAPYRWLKKSQFVPRIWHPVITMLQVQTQDGLMIKYINRGKTVATCLPELRQFRCKRIYDLVIFPPSVDKGRYS